MTPMTMRSEIAYFLKEHIFSTRIFALNMFNFVFGMFVIVGYKIGIQRDVVWGLIGLLLGTVAGILFHGVCYVLCRRRLSRKNQKRNSARPTPSGDRLKATPEE